MHTKTGLTTQDQKFINSTCRSIAKFDQHGVSELALRQQIYMLGLFTFRQFYIDLPVFPSPAIQQPNHKANHKQRHEAINKQISRIDNQEKEDDTFNI